MSRAWLLCHNYVRIAKFPYCTVNLEVISQTGRGMQETGSICHSVFQAKSYAELFALAAGLAIHWSETGPDFPFALQNGGHWIITDACCFSLQHSVQNVSGVHQINSE